MTGGVDAGATLADGVTERRVHRVVHILGHRVHVEDGTLSYGHPDLSAGPSCAQVHASPRTRIVRVPLQQYVRYAGRLLQAPEGDGETIGIGKEL